MAVKFLSKVSSEEAFLPFCRSFEHFAIKTIAGKSYVVSFSAHADCQQTTEFIQELQPRNVILVHGIFAY
jgi:Cft2 family RNA processing exonuclease